MKKNKIINIFIVTLLLSFFAMPTFAAEFYFETQNKNVSVGQQFQIDLNIDTEKESINAVEGKVVFDKDFLELSEIRSGNSIINFWVEKPVYKDGSIIFSGITPGGFVINKGLILSLIFNAKKGGITTLKLGGANTLKNDGLGTKAVLKTIDLKLNINNSVEDPIVLKEITDTESPDTFLPEVAQDPNLLDNKWFVVFLAQDKGVGIDKYEVKESKYRLFNLSKWISAESPYVLSDQNLQSYIHVKAIDKEGNMRVIKLSPKNPLVWYANIENWFIIVLVMSVALTFLYVRKNKNK